MALVFYLLLLFLHYPCLSSAYPPEYHCLGGNYTTNSTYSSNLNTLLTFFSSLNSTTFATRTEGSNPDRVYGLILCRGDVSSSDCTSCIQNAAQDVLSSCPTSKQATLWYDYCELRYSDLRFFSSFDTSNSIVIYNPRNTTNHTSNFIELQRKLLDQVIFEAAYTSPLMFASKTAVSEGNATLNGLAQCTRDLSRDNCSLCLQAIWLQFTADELDANKGGRVLGDSCNIRFESYSFYHQGGQTSPTPSPFVLSPPPSRSASHAHAPDRQDSLNKKRWITIAVTLSFVLGLLLLSYIIYFVWRKKKTRREVNWNEDEDEDEDEDLELPLYDLDIIIAGTDYFSTENKLGEGGFGPVYKGKLPEGQEIAVKRLSKTSTQGVDEFKNEVLLIAKLQHRNLVRLLGCCTRGEERILVYEYMPNKSLDAFLFDKAENINLSWRMRFNIIIGIARGLLYLHQDSRFRIIHRDLKASNVLLDEEMNPKISDFGLARIFGAEEATTRTKRVVGTYGYMSPEYAMDGIFSVKSDVFSFGVLVLEIVSGQRTKAVFLSEPEDNLLRKAWRLWSEDKGLELIDPAIGSDFSVDEIIRCIKVGLLCVQENPKARPKMSLVLHMLSEGASIFQPQQPGFVSFPSSSSTNQDLPSINSITVSLDAGR